MAGALRFQGFGASSGTFGPRLQLTRPWVHLALGCFPAFPRLPCTTPSAPVSSTAGRTEPWGFCGVAAQLPVARVARLSSLWPAGSSRTQLRGSFCPNVQPLWPCKSLGQSLVILMGMQCTHKRNGARRLLFLPFLSLPFSQQQTQARKELGRSCGVSLLGEAKKKGSLCVCVYVLDTHKLVEAVGAILNLSPACHRSLCLIQEQEPGWE